MGSSTENSAYGPTHNPWDLTPCSRRLGRRLGGRGRRRPRPLGARLRHGRLGQAAGRVLRQRRAAADLRHGLALRRRRLRVESRPGRPGDPHRARQRAAPPDHQRPRPRATRPPSTCLTSSLPEIGDLAGVRIGVPRQLNELEGIEPGVKAAVDAAIELAAGLGAEVETCELPLSVDYGLPCYYLIAPAEASANLARYDGVRYGLRVDGRRLPRDGDAHAPRGARRRAEAADHARHVRALVRLLRRLLRHGAEGADGDQARARGPVRALRPARLADLRDDGVPARGEGRRTRSRCT